jgi:polyhydroxyalkanoate synthesis regulator phasin
MDTDVNFKDIINKVKRLNEKEKYHILYILQKNNIEYTKNNNGYFFNLDKIDKIIIEKINKCIDLIEKNREIIKELDKKRNMHLEYYKQLIEDKLEETRRNKKKNIQDKLVMQSEKEDFIFFIKKKPKKRQRPIPGCDINENDPDILMKSYLKFKKITKCNYLYNLVQCISKRKSKVNEVIEESGDINPYTDDNIGGDIVGDVENGGDVENVGDIENGDVENGDDYCVSEEIEVEEVNLEQPLDKNDENEFYLSDNEYEDDDKDSEIDDTQTKNIEEDLLDYYKNLLKKTHGMQFNDDKYVLMSRPKYIERKL